MNMDKKIQTASPLGPDEPITALTKPWSVRGRPKTRTRKFILFNLRKYMAATIIAKINELPLKKM